MPQSKKTLIVGATPNASRYAYIATEMLHSYGHEVILFGVKKGAILDFPIQNDWPLDDNIDTITLYINPTTQEAYYEHIINSKPKRIIFNPGTENPILENLARLQNIETMNACTLVLLRTNQY
jgi:uncharacterized protein